MRFTDKLIATIKKAYEHYAVHKNRQYLDLRELINSADIVTDNEEVVNLGKRLEGDGLVIFHLKYGKYGTPHIYLTSDGIDKCESGVLFDIDTIQPDNAAAITVNTAPANDQPTSTDEIKNSVTQEIMEPELASDVIPPVNTSATSEVVFNEPDNGAGKLPTKNTETFIENKAVPEFLAAPTDANGQRAATLLELLHEIKIAASLNEDLRVREVKELMERIEEISVYIKAQSKIPKYGFNDFLLAINEIEPMDNFIPRLEKYLP